MEIRLARFLAIAVVIVVLGGLLLSGRARRVERQLAARQPAADTVPAGPLDSARAVALAVQAYRADHAARGEPAPAVTVVSFVADSLGFDLVLAPAGAGPGARAQVRVQLSGQVELRRAAR
jgi:hypothetical protein